MHETTKVNILNLLTGWQTTADFKEQWFEKTSLANEKEVNKRLKY